MPNTISSLSAPIAAAPQTAHGKINHKARSRRVHHHRCSPKLPSKPRQHPSIPGHILKASSPRQSPFHHTHHHHFTTTMLNQAANQKKRRVGGQKKNEADWK
jgi:hypothetical protein